jgi:hypothetical protein
MKIRHPAVKTNLLKLVSTYELDLNLGPELNFPLRLEVFRDTENANNFRVHIWESEHFNLEPTFPVKRNGKKLSYKSSELIMLERGTQLGGNYESFKAKDANDAVRIVIKDLKQRLEHWTTVTAK